METFKDRILSDEYNNKWNGSGVIDTYGDFFWVQLAINLTGIVGNILVIISHFMGDLYMVSVNDFVLALAFSDLIAAILLLPLPKFVEMPQNFLGKTYCILVLQDSLFWIAIKTSVFLMMVIALESAAAVRKPFLYNKIFCSKKYRLLIVLLIWVVSTASNLYHFFTDRVTDEGECEGIHDNMSINGDAENNTNTSAAADGSQEVMISLYVYTVTYIIPLFVMIIAYSLTAIRLRQNMFKMNRRNSVFARARHRVIGVVFCDIIVFIVCLTPSEIIFLLDCFGINSDVHLLQTLDGFRDILHSVYVCANPIIYTVTNPQFRLILRRLFRRPVDGKTKSTHWAPSKQPETSINMRSNSTE